MTAAAPSLSAEIARFAVGPISDSASAGAMMRLSAFDWAAVAAAGANDPVAQAVRAMIDDEGGAFHDSEADAALFNAIERALFQTGDRQLLRLPLHINDPAFAAACVAAFTEIARPGSD